jgi:transcription elongation factor GreA
MILPKFPRSRRESTGTPAKSELKGVRIFMAKEYKLSPQRLKELQDELTYLKTTREKEVAELIKEARSFGDLSENSEYDEAKNEQGKLYARIGELEDILSNYVVIEEDETEGDYVRLGSIVTLFDKEFQEELTYKIVGSQEADPMNGSISEDSPLGRALLGKNAGDEVVVDAPAGPVEYKLMKIER